MKGSTKQVKITQLIAQYLAEENFDNIPSEIIKKITDSLVDTIGCAVLGSNASISCVLSSCIDSWNSIGESAIWGTDKRAAAPFAAMVNSASSHAWDFDDTTLPGLMHPGCVAVPTGISIAEKKIVSGREFMTALAAGYEISNLLGTALGSREFVSTGFYNSVPVIFAAVGVAGKLMKLNEGEFVAALGIAATQASGLYSATMTKRLNSPKAVMNGILAVELAKRGLEAPPDGLEAPYGGFLTSFTNKPNIKYIIDNIGSYKFKVYHKFYPCIRSNQPAVAAVSELMSQHPEIRSDLIDRIVVHADKTTIEYTVETTGGGTVVETVGNALISLPYCVAAMIVDKKLTVEQFTDNKVHNEEVQELLKKVELINDPEIDKLPPVDRYRCKVDIYLKNGLKVHKHLTKLKGDPTNRLTQQEAYEKFISNTSKKLGNETSQNLFDKLTKILEADNVGDLSKYLSI